MDTFLQNFHIQLDYNSPVILSYLVLSLGACFLNFLTRGKTNRLFFSCYRSSPWNPLTYLRLFSHCIGHHDIHHLIHNFLFILLIGPMIEEKYGSSNLIMMFLITSFIIALWNLLFHNYRVLGASGNVYLLIVLSSFVNITEGKIPLTLILIFIFYILSEMKSNLVEGNKKVYHTGHLIGAFLGLLFGFYFFYGYTLPWLH